MVFDHITEEDGGARRAPLISQATSCTETSGRGERQGARSSMHEAQPALDNEKVKNVFSEYRENIASDDRELSADQT